MPAGEVESCKVLIEIVILAMIAAFLGMRLYSVLGNKAEHEEEMITNRLERAQQEADREAEAQQAQQAGPAGTDQRNDRVLTQFSPAIEAGLRDISAADRSFQLLPFMEGAKAAYEVVLDAFWRGDKEELKVLCDDDVYQSFSAAIDDREANQLTLDNRLIRIEDTTIHSAVLDGKTARIAVRFVADIASVTRDKDDNVVAGSLDDAIESRDVWTFSRDTRSDDPNWLLDETDAG